MDSPKQQLADKLKSANNILVTVSRNPSVDQLAACIALTLVLNKQGKHAAAVFSGAVPSTLEFLQPEETLEKNTDSLRDFIIALDKSKADKLRYKVEDNVVRIFITPYKTSISQADLEFSQGDFNVDVVVGLGVAEQGDLDEAITAHGRILHDAAVTTINVSTQANLGVINWNDPAASSLSELVTELTQMLGKDLLDGQIATALLTGIVAETDRFSNEKTSPQTMNASAALMGAGANQQLVASKLEEPQATTSTPAEVPAAVSNADSEAKTNDGTLEIEHGGSGEAPTDNQEPATSEPSKADSLPDFELPQPVESTEPEPEIPEQEPEPPNQNELSPGSKLITEAPTMGGVLTANSQPEGLDPSIDPLSAPDQTSQLLDHNKSTATPTETPSLDELLGRDANHDELPQLNPVPDMTMPGRKVIAPLEPTLPEPMPIADSTPVFEPATAEPEPTLAPLGPSPEPIVVGLTPPPPAWVPPSQDPFNLAGEEAKPAGQTLSEIEALVKSEHAAADAHLLEARDQVQEALNSSTSSAAPTPIQALNAQPLGDELHPADTGMDVQPGPGYTPAPSVVTPDQLPPAPIAPEVTQSAPAPQVFDPNAPPPVPPPIPFQFGSPSNNPPAS